MAYLLSFIHIPPPGSPSLPSVLRDTEDSPNHSFSGFLSSQDLPATTAVNFHDLAVGEPQHSPSIRLQMVPAGDPQKMPGNDIQESPADSIQASLTDELQTLPAGDLTAPPRAIQLHLTQLSVDEPGTLPLAASSSYQANTSIQTVQTLVVPLCDHSTPKTNDSKGCFCTVHPFYDGNRLLQDHPLSIRLT